MTTREAINYLLDPLSLPESMDIKDKLRWHEDAVNMAIEALKAQDAKPDEKDHQKLSDSDKLGVKTGETCADAISREVAIDAVQSIERLATMPDNDAVVRMSAVEYVLYHLPSAQPNLQPTCNRLATDCISRQAVIDLWEQYHPYIAIKACEYDAKLRRLPSAQADSKELSFTHKALDTISRQAAMDALNEYFARIGKLKRRGLTKGEKAISLDTVGTVKTLPSVQPERQTGHWERDGHHIKCSVCGIWMCDTDREGDAIPNSFCPNCGADMKGEQDGVD